MSGFGEFSGLGKIALPLWGLALYLGAGLFTLQFTAISQERAWDFLYPQITIGVMALVTVSLVRDAKQIKTFGWLLMMTLGYLAYNFNLQYLDNEVYLRLRGFGGIDNNGVAMVMVMAVPLGFFMALYSHYHLKKIWLVVLCGLLMLAETHVVLFSFSRGGQLGLCVVGSILFCVAFFVLPNKGLTIMGGVIATVITIYLAGEEVRERFWTIFVDEGERDASAASRFDTWRGAWHCMLDHPMGVGPRCFNLISQQYGLSRNKSVHNLFLQTGADYGFAGMIGLAIFYISTAVKCFLMTMTATAKKLVWPRYFGHMVSLSLGGMLVCSTFIGMESVEVGFLIALVGLCTVAYVDRVKNSGSQDELNIIPELVEVPNPNDDPDEMGFPQDYNQPHQLDLGTHQQSNRELVSDLVRGSPPIHRP